MRAPALNDLQSVACAGCHNALELAGGTAVPFGQFWYHVKCLPVCRTCGREIKPDEEAVWSYSANLVSTPFGYAQHPRAFTCPTCTDSSLLDEEPYLD
jgi:predicted RNA-binding Zn-ribbon protein involved in translation (DUF1610 family)